MGFQSGKRASHTSPARTIADLQVGERAVVREIGGDDRMAVRLLEMGFVPGAEVALIKKAPLGDPLELRLRGFHVSLRKAEARALRVEAPVETPIEVAR